MRQHQHTLTIATRGRGLTDISRAANDVVADSGIVTGLATLFCRHTSCSLLLNENADPDVRMDLEAFFARLVPEGDPLYRHSLEGTDDMPAHVKTALTASSLAIPVAGGRLLLGTWQGLFLFEHRAAPHQRQVVVHVLGEGA